MQRSRKKGRCIRCGREDIFKEYLCKDCYMELHPAAGDIKLPKLTVCPSCKRYRLNKRWFNYDDLDSLIISSVKKHNPSLSSIYPADEGRKKDIIIRSDNHEYIFPIDISKEQCPHCQKEKSSYYEAVIQLRSIPKKVEKILLSSIKEDISNIKVSKEGSDIFLRSRNKIRAIKKIISKEYPVIIKETKKLFTEDRHSGKRIYRFTVLFRGVRFKPGNILRFRGKDYTIIWIEKRNILVKDEKGDKKRLSFDMLERYKAI